MLSRYAGVGTTCPQFTVIAASGGSLTGSGSLYFSFQLQNRAGFNAPAVSSQISYTAGEKIVITIPDTVRKPGWDIHYFEISAGTTSDPSTHVAIARYSGFQFGSGIDPQTLLSTLPTIIELSRDQHIALAPTVANLAALPVGLDRLDGQTRWVTSESKFFEYRADSVQVIGVNVIAADIGQWVRVASPTTYVENSTEGSDRALPSVEPTSIVPTPNYPGDTLEKTLPDWELKHFIYNDTGSNLPEGIEFGLQLEYNNRRSPALLAGLIFVSFLGFVDVDGNLRTTKISDSTEFVGIGGYVEWLPEIETNFLLPDDLLPGESILIAVKPCFSAAELDFYSDERSGSTGMSSGDIFGIKPAIVTQPSSYSSLGLFLSSPNVVADRVDLLRIVPDIGLSYKALSGTAMIASRIFPIKPERVFSLQAQNTAGQKIIVDTRGNFYSELSSYSLTSNEALRAIASTLSGESHAGINSSYVANSGTGSFDITLNYPCTAGGLGTIRSDYPDVIAGNAKGSFNPYGVSIYLQREDTLEIRKFTGNLVVAGVSQAVTISNWTSGTIVGSLPSTLFGLFTPGTSSLTVDGSGTFPATNYRVSYTFTYDGNQITDIDHSSPPCIYEWIGDLQPPSVAVDPNTITLPAGDDVLVENLGTGNAAILKFSIPQGNDGTSGFNAYTTTTASFVVPGIGNTVTIIVAKSDWMVIGQLIFIETAGSFTVTARPTTTSATIRNDGYQGNASPAITITTTKGVSPSGAVGLSGTSGYTTTTASFVQPAVSSNVTVSVVDSNWMSSGLIIYLQDGGYYIIVSKPNSISVIITNLGYPGNTAVSSTVATSKIISSGGLQGATGSTGATGGTGSTGATGQPSYSNTTNDFIQPGSGSNITIAIGSSAWAVIGSNVRVATGGTYQVISKPSAVQLEIQNLASETANAAPGVTISSGALVSPTGTKGTMGSPGTVGSASGLILTGATSITTGAGEYGVYFDNVTGFPVYRLPSNGTVNILGNYQQAVYYEPITTPSTPGTSLAFFVDSADNLFKSRLSANGVIRTYSYSEGLEAYTATKNSSPISFDLPTSTTSATGYSWNNTTKILTLDGAARNIFIITLTGNINDLTMNNIQVGATYIIYLIEDGTGGAVITLNSIFKRLVGDTSTFNTAANKVNMITGIARSSSAITLAQIAVEV